MKTTLRIDIYLTDGSVESFKQSDASKTEAIWKASVPAQLFAHPRLIIAGTHFKSVFVCSEIVRINFMQSVYDEWHFPEGYSDVVELSEADFRKHAQLDQPDLMPKREDRTVAGDPLVSFLKLHFKHSPPIYLMVEFSVKLPVENQSFMRVLLSKSAFQMRLPNGGVALVNLANLSGYVVYPGVAEVPTDAWLAEPIERFHAIGVKK
jgi:hypothetical protein